MEVITTNSQSNTNNTNKTINTIKANNKNLFSIIPNDIIENDILTFLNTKDLFFSIRGVGTEWSDYMRNIWCVKIKDEMVDQVKAIDLVYEKEVFAKTYEFKIKYLLNYKNLLTLYIINSNICNIINHLNSQLENNESIRMLVKLFFIFLNMEQSQFYLENNENENLFDYLRNEVVVNEINEKVLNLLKTDSLHEYNLIQLNEFKVRFNQLNKETLENYSEHSKLVYSFLLGLIEYQILKLDIRDLKSRIENLINTIQESARIWPRKRLFFERAYKILLYSKNSYEDLKIVTRLFEDSKIRHPLIDFNDDSLKMIINLKERLNDPNFDVTKLDETIFENILNRRVLLTKKIMILEKFLAIYRKSKINENEYNIKGMLFTKKQLLWSLKFSSNDEGENVSEDSVLRTRYYLDDYFDFEKAIIYSCPEQKKNAILEDLDNEVDLEDYFENYESAENNNASNSNNKGSNDNDEFVIDNCIKEEFRNYDLENEMYENEKNTDLNISNRRKISNSVKKLEKETGDYLEITVKNPKKPCDEDIEHLRNQKNELTAQKEKTEHVLQMLKKFLVLKENVLNNKKKYKFILYILTKVRKDNMQTVSFESIQNLIKDLDIDEIMQSNEFNLSDSEINELENFDSTEKLLQDIEVQLFKHVDDVISKINK